MKKLDITANNPDIRELWTWIDKWHRTKNVAELCEYILNIGTALQRLAENYAIQVLADYKIEQNRYHEPITMESWTNDCNGLGTKA